MEDNTTDCSQQCCKDLKGSDQVLEIKTNSLKVFFTVEAKLQKKLCYCKSTELCWHFKVK